MDWDKCNFKKINQRRKESKRWEKVQEAEAEKAKKKGGKHQPAKKRRKK